MSNSLPGSGSPLPLANGLDHIAQLQQALSVMDVSQLQQWGKELAVLFARGGRLLVAGNGGSAAEAQHLTSELVGRLRDDRQPFSAIALHADTSTVTAIANDYGVEEVFARQVRGHGRPGDILILLSTSGRSANLLRAAEAAREVGLTVWALTGPGPNPLAELADDAVAISGAPTATVQECHLVAVHILCATVDITFGVCPPVTQEPDWSQDSRPRLVVVGDALLDRDLVGVVERVSPEAPTIAVDRVETRTRPGGAGLAAVLAARSGRPVTLVTALSTDAAGRELSELLRQHGVDVIDLGLDGPTPVKCRVRAADRTVLMFSQNSHRPCGIRRSLTDEEQAHVVAAGAVLVSDYGRGVASDPSVRETLAAAASSRPMVWDPHPLGAPPVPHVRLVTPNSKEAAGFAAGVPGKDLSGDIDRGQALVGLWSGASVVVTRGASGAVLLDSAGSSPLNVPGPPVGVADSCGAGDCFGVSAAWLLAEGALLSEAVIGAVGTASRFVAAGGASSLSEEPQSPEQEGHPVGEDAAAVVARVRAEGGTVVATGGCFDLLHAGHVALLESARRLGSCLVVCLNDDDSVSRLKGADRPIVSARDRAEVLSALASVDSVALFSEDTPVDVLGRIKPDIYVKGGDYRTEDIPEAALVAAWGGKTVILPYVNGRSTTDMIDKILQPGRPA
jgi:D-beta-D-heptose 7-phosphate kinase / D-beta-D-heptose 1-phosphate adenosyltransferase